MLDHGTGVGLETRHGASDVAVDLNDLLYRRGLEKGGCDALLDTEDDAAAGCDTDGGGTELDGLKGVFNLEKAALWRKGAASGG